MFKLGKTSKERLSTCHSDIQLIMNEAIKITNVDFGIAEGHRSIKKQQQYFKEGKSKIDGVNKKGKHNYTPSLAVDIYPYFDNGAKWDNEHLSYLSGIIHAVSEILFAYGKITHKVRWGGNWDMDGIILIDQSFDDRPHFELVLP
jgi:peptidoglycan L-alanyl-D-glutamate endopeptidase CwlK